MAFKDSLAEVIVGDIKDADVESLLGHGDVLHDLLHVLFVGEKECVHVLRLCLVQILLHLVYNFTQVSEHLPVTIMLHLFHSGLKHNVHCGVATVTMTALRHFAELLGDST